MSSTTSTSASHNYTKIPTVESSTSVSLKHWWDYIPYTWLGLICGVFSLYLNTNYGESKGDYLIRTSMTCFISILVILGVLMWIEAYRVTRWLKSVSMLINEKGDIEVGQWFATDFNAKMPWMIPLFQLNIQWVVPEQQAYELQKHKQKLLEFVSLNRRGYYKQIDRIISVEDLFGFTRINIGMYQQCRLKILPQSSLGISTDIQQMQVGEDFYDVQGMPQGDLVEVRRYQEGDPNKLIIWRLYARNRQLMVRTPERALSLKQDLLAYFIADPHDESSAITTRSYLEKGLLGNDFMFFADGCTQAAHDLSMAIDHLLHSAHADTLSAFHLIQALDQQRQRSCLIFASTSSSIEDLQSIQQRLPHPPSFILSYPDTLIHDDDRGTSNFFFKDQSHDINQSWAKVQREHMQQLRQTLIQGGSQVTIIAQPAGQVIFDFDL